ncbi:GlxA family transcriptional regulator [Noviherbaspirillum galbum]|uniref:Helix-turn-helix domain-containing protein n=1 Tax=Noviherbaspirillum galbum TaxID=2709383 RepID=A0A6B3SRG1_9BURK|nr:helix-turn-helix domain-containing protein [Noviherbaspirillum galbum]NEX63284.1 helix-turn-helix domain-containing protein [Noviherbaspirillum galbum]
MKTILVAAFDGLMDSSLAITLDTLKAGAAFLAHSRAGGKVQILTVGQGKTIRTASGLSLTPDLRLRDLPEKMPRPDWVVVTAGGLLNEEAIEERFSRPDAMALAAWLAGLDTAHTRVAVSCSSVFLLARAGLLEGRSATMTWWLAHLFRRLHPGVKLDETRMLVSDGPYLTAGSAFSQLDLSLAVVADTMGVKVAHLVSRYLLIDQRPSQARYMMPTHAKDVDPTVVAAERWIDAHLSEPLTVARLASALAVSPKTLARRVEAASGISPVKLIQRRRLMRAAHLVETTPLSIDRIAEEVGYQDGTALRKLMKREFGATPTALRK